MKPLMARRTCGREKSVYALMARAGRFSSPHHGVLAHQDDALATEGVSDFVHLLGADIVDADDKNRREFFKKTLELIEIASLVF